MSIQKQFISLLIFITLLSSCTKKITIDNELLDIDILTKKMTDSSLLQKSYATQGYELSRSNALDIALSNNASLLADLETLDIAKSDLVQAGLYSNPEFDVEFQFPKKRPNTTTQVDLNITWLLSDLWQVPLRKKVADDELAITIQRITRTIADLFVHTMYAYNACLKSALLITNAQSTIQQAQELKNQIAYRENFGYATAMDVYVADVNLQMWQATLIAAEADNATALILLRTTLGLKPHIKPAIVEHTFSLPDASTIPDMHNLITYALSHRPEMVLVHLKIERAKDTLCLERGRIIKEVRVGFSYNKDFEGNKGPGPAFGLSIPLFDSNFAQIAKARNRIEKAEKELKAIELLVIQEVERAYMMVIALLKEVHVREKMLISYQQAIDYARKYEKSMQMTELVAMQLRMQLYEERKRVIDTQYQAANALYDLERAVGKRII